MDVICQAKSGMGKTAVFVLSTLQQIEPIAGQVAALVLCHTRELAYQARVLFLNYLMNFECFNMVTECVCFEKKNNKLHVWLDMFAFDVWLMLL